MQLLLLIIPLLLFTCDENNLVDSEVVEGCINESAVNYNSEANKDDESCIYCPDGYVYDGTSTIEDIFSATIFDAGCISNDDIEVFLTLYCQNISFGQIFLAEH